MDLYLPRYGSPKNPNGIVPPSPPAETRAKRRAEMMRDLRTYRGTLPPVQAPGYDESARVILPGMPAYQETLERAICMPAGSACVMGASGAPPVSADWNNIFAYYNMDQASGANRTDSTPNGYTLTNNGTVNQQTGKINYAAGAYSATDYLSISSNGDFSNANSFSMTGWLYIPSRPKQCVLGKGPTAGVGPGWEWEIDFGDTSGSIGWAVGYNSGNSYTGYTITILNATTWYFLACVFNTTGPTIGGSYNGASIGTNAFGGTRYAGSAPVWFGKPGTGSHGSFGAFNGYLDGWAFFKSAISNTQISGIYNSGTGKDYPN